jgi:hypothetical protein
VEQNLEGYVMTGNKSGGISERKFLFDSLDIFALWSFSVTQPLFNLISQNGTFLVAHDCGPFETLLFALILALILPACLVLLESVFRLINRHSYRIVHYLFAFCLVVLFALSPLKKVTSLPDIAILSLAIGVGLAFLLTHTRFPLFRKMLRVCSVSVLLFPLVFILTGQPRELIFSIEEEDTPFHIDPAGKPPIVMVMFDEIASPYIQDEKGRIDALRYPNFAALASGSYWFPNALSVSDNTYQGVPAILTGQYYTKVGDRGRLPALVDYPHNLFTLLDGTYELNVVETSTKLCPDEYEEQTSLMQGLLPLLSALFVDTGVVYLNMVTPPRVGSRLPDVTQNWEGFLKSEKQKPKRVDGKSIFGSEWVDFFLSNQKSRDKLFRDFISSIRLSERPVLNFLDIGIPHMPMEYYPSGKRYTGADLDLFEDRWPEDDWYVKGHFQRYMLQLGFVDTLIGELINGLKESGIYDKCLIVVTADHGVSYRPGDKRRTCRETNFADLMSIPLFFKLPDQKKGIVDTRYVESIDIVPSIADALGVEIPWSVDGVSLFLPQYQEKSQFRLASHKKPREWVFEKEDVERQIKDLKRRVLSIFGSGSSKPNGLFAIGPHEELLGKIPDTDIPVRNGPLKTKINEQPFFYDLDLAWEVLPLYISGHVETARFCEELPKTLAISLNNRVWGTTKPFANGDFSAMLPEEALIQGRNSIEVLAVSSSEDTDFHLVQGDSPEDVGKYALTESGILNTVKEKYHFIVPSALKLYLEGVKLHPGYTEFIGWAADTFNSKPVDTVIVFTDGQSVHATSTTIPRTDIAEYFRDDHLIMSGFRFRLPNGLLERDTRLFAVSEDVATEATYPKDSVLNKARSSPVVDSYSLEDDVIIHRWTKEEWAVKPRLFEVYLEKVVKKENHIELVGWAEDSKRGKAVEVVIVFADGQSVYDSPTNVPRFDVPKSLENDHLTMSGFRFRLPSDLLEKDLRVFAISEGLATEAQYPKDSGRFKARFSPVVKSYSLNDDAITHRWTRKEWSVTPYALNVNLEKIIGENDRVELVGWAADTFNRKRVEKVIVFADGKSGYISSTNIPRTDVAELHQDDRLTMSGFRFQLPNDLLEKDLRLFAISGNIATEAIYPKGSALDKVRFSTVIDTYLLENDIIIHRLTKEEWSVKPHLLEVHLDKVVKKEDHTELSGWAEDPNNDKGVDAVILFADGQSVYDSPTNIPRFDVARSQKSDHLTMSGFRFLLPNDLLEKNLRLFALSEGLATEAQYPEDSELHKVRFSPIVKGYSLEDDIIIHRWTGKEWSVSPDALEVHLEKIVKEDGRVELIGWAEGRKKDRLVEKVIVFADGQSVHITSSTMPRDDDAKSFKENHPSMAGFRFLLSDDLLEKDIRVFAISEGAATEAQYPEDSELRKVRFTPTVKTYSLDKNIITHDWTGKKWFVKPHALKVYVEKIVNENGRIELIGWSVDHKNNKLVDRIIVFRGHRSLHAASTSIPREGVAKWHENEDFLLSGFQFFTPEEGMNDIRVFAIAGQTATEAYYPEDLKSK